MPSDIPIILVATGHEDSLAMYAIGLLAQGFQTLTADTADNAFTRASIYRPDIIVADAWLPGEPMRAFTRRLQEDPRTTAVRIVVLTSERTDSRRQWPGQPECDLYVLKPCAPDELGRALRDLLELPLAPDRMAPLRTAI
jgi:DNA-binding response OmpR family regulator